MTLYQKGSEKVENYREYRYFTTGQMGGLAREKTSRLSLERDKKTRREIANSNERRRMQSINSGFQQLKALLPDTEDDKRSKSVILHQAVEHIAKLESEKAHLLNQNSKLMCLVQQEMDGRMVVKRKRMNSGGGASDDSDVSNIVSPLIVEGKVDAYYQTDNVLMLNKMEKLVKELRGQLEDERKKRLACERQLDSIKVALKCSSSTSSSTSSSSSTLLSTTSSSSLSPMSALMSVQKSAQSSIPCTSLLSVTTSSMHQSDDGKVIDESHHCLDGDDGDVAGEDAAGRCGKSSNKGALLLAISTTDNNNINNNNINNNNKIENIDKKNADKNENSKEEVSVMIGSVDGQTAAVHGVVEDEVHCSIQTSQPLIGTANNNITDAIVDNDTKVLTTYSMSRRNLETIVEAIKHLEGEKEPTFTPKVIQPEHQRQQLQKTTTQQQQQKQITQQQQQQHLSIIPQILIQHQQLVPQHLPFLKSPQKHQVKKTISHEHQVLKLLQQQQQQLLHKSTSLLQVAKNVHHHQQQQQQQAHLHQQLQTSQFISLIQPSSPYCSPLSSPPLSSTPPQIMPHPLTSPTTHHFLSPIIICSPDSTFLKGATQLASLTTLDQS